MNLPILRDNETPALLNKQSEHRRRPDDLDLGNWRDHPQSQWAFQHVRELMPTAKIEPATSGCRPLEKNIQDLQHIQVESPHGACSLNELLEWNHVDTFLVLHREKIVTEWCAPHYNASGHHILFSVSKSMTGLLAGILEQEGLIDSEAPVADFVRLPKSCAYSDCTIRHLLDMSVALEFEENYTDRSSEYVKYRIATGWNPADQDHPDQGLQSFLYGLKKSSEEHGHLFLYRSPNTDMLGLVLEKAAGLPLADLFSHFLWQPMGAESDAYISLDRYGAARAAGGVCVTVHDLARIGQLFLDHGQANGNDVITPAWLHDTCNNGNRRAWDRGNYKHKLPNGNYRNQWYQIGDEDGSMSARGIHGQLLYINPARSVVIVKLASQPEPLNDSLTASFFTAFDKIAKTLGCGKTRSISSDIL